MRSRRPRLALRSRRRGRLKRMAALSLALHVEILLVVLIVVRLPPLPTEPPSVEIVAEASPPAEAPSSVPAEPLPPPAEMPPTPDIPPQTEAQVPPPPPPPDETEVAAVGPPPPEPPPPPPPQAVLPPPPTVQPPPPPAVRPPPPPQRATAPPRRSPAPARTATATQPSPAPATAPPAPPAEAPDTSVRVEGAELGPDWIRQLQAWWDRHAFYPGEAAQENVSGTVKVHIVVRPDGEVPTIHVEQSSGSRFIDNAAYQAFTSAHLHPFPAGTPAPKADVYITLHYVLTHGQVAAAAAVAKRPFTVTDKPVDATNASSLQQKTCVGNIVVDSATGGLDSWYGRHGWARAAFYRAPDGKPRVKFSTSWYTEDVAISESNGSVGWLGPAQKMGPPGFGIVQMKYSLWPAGPDHVGGSVFDIYKPDTKGAIELNCDPGASEQTQR